MIYYFKYQISEFSQPVTEEYEAEDLTDAWNQFIGSNPNWENYYSIEVTDEDEGIHPRKPPGHQTT